MPSSSRLGALARLPTAPNAGAAEVPTAITDMGPRRNTAQDMPATRNRAEDLILTLIWGRCMHAMRTVRQQMINPRAPALAFSYPTFLGGLGSSPVLFTNRKYRQSKVSFPPPPLTSELKILVRKLGSAGQYLLSSGNPCPPAVGYDGCGNKLQLLLVAGSFRSRRAGQNRGHVCRNPSGPTRRRSSSRPRAREPEKLQCTT